MKSSKRILVAGATGYIGARLVPRLLQAGYTVRAISRSLPKLQGCHWSSHPQVELVAADMLDLQSLISASKNCDIAFYLVHSMNPQHRDFAKADRQAALNMVSAAETCSLQRIIYLGGLGEENQELSKHLSSRAEVARIFQNGSVPATILRAAMIIGSGSASFEILRYLVDRLPFMITPRWVRTPSQPIAIRNVLEYLTGCLNNKSTIGQMFDIGGPNIIRYQELMDIYAQEAGLPKRIVIPIPFFSPRLSSYWIHLVTPVPAYIARPLAEGLRNPTICRDARIRQLIPQQLLDCRTAIRLAIARIQHEQIESHWTDAGMIPPSEWISIEDPPWAGGTIYHDDRSVVVNGTPANLWQPLLKLGGKTGWYYGNWLWQIRGFIDRILGGVGLSRGRRHGSQLRVGDVLDFWRVAAIEPDKRLLLVAEMKLPGKAILEFQIEQIDNAQVRLRQTAKFLPSGLLGIIYWLAVSPLHNLIFDGMLRGIIKARTRPEHFPSRTA